MEKFSNDRHNHNKCEGEFGLYYEQKMKQKIMEEFEEEEEDKKRFEVKVNLTAIKCDLYNLFHCFCHRYL